MHIGVIMTTFAIVGSRSITDKKIVFDILDKYRYQMTKIVSGGAKGIDSLAREYGEVNGIEIEEFLPEWERFSKSAGMIRNKTIIENSDYTIALWDGESKGTLDSIKYSKKLDHDIDVYQIINNSIKSTECNRKKINVENSTLQGFL